jgi:hypothetical protein
LNLTDLLHTSRPKTDPKDIFGFGPYGGSRSISNVMEI